MALILNTVFNFPSSSCQSGGHSICFTANSSLGHNVALGSAQGLLCPDLIFQRFQCETGSSSGWHSYYFSTSLTPTHSTDAAFNKETKNTLFKSADNPNSAGVGAGLCRGSPISMRSSAAGDRLLRSLCVCSPPGRPVAVSSHETFACGLQGLGPQVFSVPLPGSPSSVWTPPPCPYPHTPMT